MVQGIRSESYYDRLWARELSRRGFLIAAGGAAGGLTLTGLLAACGQAATAHADTLNVAVADLGTQVPDPLYSYSHSAMYSPIALSIGEQLYRRGYDGQHTPALATAYTVSPDNLTWTFTLRQGVKNHDGSTFTSNDVQTSIKRVQNKNNTGDFVSNEALVAAISNLNIIDDYHLAITTQTPYFRMLDDMPIPVATDYYNSVGEAAFRKHPIAAGPLKFKSQSLNTSMTFTRFDGFWDPSRSPNFNTLNLLLLPDESTRVAGLQSGSIDVVNALSPVAIKQLQGSSGIRLIQDPDSVMVYMLFAACNPNHPTPAKLASPTHDVRVRQAMLYALDRTSMAKVILGGDATPLATMDLPITYGQDTALKPFGFDPGKARQLLQDANASGFSFTLVSKNADEAVPQEQDLCLAMVSNWQDVGIDATYQPMDPALQASLQDSWTFDGGFVFSQQGVKLYDPTYESSHYFSLSSGNVSFDDAKLNDYNTQLNTTLDPSVRAQLAKAYDDYTYELIPGLGLFSLSVVNAIGPRVKQWTQQAGNGGAGPFWGLRSV